MLSWHPHHIVKKMIIVCWSGDNSASTARLLPPTYLCHLFFSNFRSKAEWSEPAGILSWYVRFEDIDESKKEGKGGEACWVGVSELWRREGGRERGREKGGEKRKVKWCNTTDTDVTHLLSLLCEWASLHQCFSPCSHQTQRPVRRTISCSLVGIYFSSYFRKKTLLNGVTCTTYLKFCLQACGTACVFKLEWFCY